MKPHQVAKSRLRFGQFLSGLFCAWILAYSNGTFAGHAADNLFFAQLENQEELSQSIVRAIVQDKQGFIWIGTEDGLNRYDGYEFKAYKKKNSGLSDNLIRSLTIDGRGVLWVGTEAGLNIYDSNEDRFILPIESIGSEGSVNTIYDLEKDPLGGVWAATNNGLYFYDANYTVGAHYLHRLKEKTSTYYRALMHDEVVGKLWVGTTAGELLYLDLVNGSELKSATPNKNNLGYIVGIEKLGDNKLLIASFDNGLFSFDVETMHFTKIDLNKSQSGITGKVAIRTIEKISDNEYWLGSDDNGVLVFHPESNQVKAYKTMRSKDFGLPNSNQVHNIFVDRSGLIWVGTSKYLNKVNPNAIKFNNYKHDPASPHSITGDLIYSIYKDSQDRLWIGTGGEGFSVSKGEDPEKFLSYTELGIENNSILSVFAFIEDSDSRILIGHSEGLLGLDANLEQLNNFSITKNGKPYNSAIREFLSTDEGIWIASKDGVGFLNDGIYGDIREISNAEPLKNAVNVLLEKDSDSLWVGTDKGLWIVDKKSRSIVESTSFNAALEELSDESILDLLITKDKKLWIGTLGSGLKWIDLANPQTGSLSTDQGFHNDTIYSITEGSEGELWLGTGNGLIRLEIADNKWAVFNSNSDGQPIKEFNGNSSHVDNDGNIYLGGTNGFILFDPSAYIEDPVPPEAALTKFRILNQKDVGFGQGSRLDKPINLAEELTLRNRDNAFTFEFAALQMAYPEKNKYKYMLSGFDENWISVDDHYRRATYTNLDAGSYMFNVKAANKDLVWGPERKIRVTILPSKWASPLAIVLYVLFATSFVLLIAYLLWSRYSERKLAEQKVMQSEERLKLSLWGSGDELWDWEIDSGALHLANEWDMEFPRDGKRSGYSLANTNIHPNDLPHVKSAIDSHLDGKTEHYETAYRVSGRRGDWVWVLDRGKIVSRDEHSKPVRMAGTLKNITDIKSAEEQLRIIVKSFEHISDAVWILDTEFRYVAINKAFSRVTGYGESEIIGKPIKMPDTQSNKEGLLERIKTSLEKDGQWKGELHAARKNGEIYPIELSIDLVRDSDSEITHFVGVFSDITFRKKAEQELRRLASFDHLTGLPNRTLFKERLEHAIVSSARNFSRHALLFIDLDNFKRVNDSLGHSIGDELLATVARVLKNSVRAEDTVARLGGDEFTILIEEIKDWRTPAKIAQKILDELAVPLKLTSHEVVVTPSVGIVIYPEDGARAEELMRNSDTAMYHAKSKGKNNYQFFTKQMNVQAKLRLELENEMRIGLDNDEFILYYQPKICLKSGVISGLEALVRWQNPRRGLMFPDEFIYLAEETGFITKLGETVMKKACEQLKNWQDKGVFGGHVAVNLSAMQFYNEKLVDTVDSILADTQIEPEMLELEITEGMVMHNMARAIEQMKALRARKIRLALDDFGVGYSSLSNLKDFPLNSLKIDRTFIWDIAESERELNMVAAIVNLAHNLSLSVVAEGVETDAQLACLQEMNCEEVQGFIYSEPLPVAKIEKLIMKGKPSPTSLASATSV